MNEFGLTVWEKPKYYFGFSPVGDFLIYAVNRDSSLLETSNWKTMWEAFEELNKKYDTGDYTRDDLVSGQEQYAYQWCASHAICGWIEYMMLRVDCPREYQETAAQFLTALSEYPVLDEDHYCELQSDAVMTFWSECSFRERVGYCKEVGISIFAARRINYLPAEVEDRLRDQIY